MTEQQRIWVAFLARLVYPHDSAKAAAAMLHFIPLLQFPDAAFTNLSAEFVAMAPRRMAIPSYDEVAAPISAWWREHRPSSLVIIGPIWKSAPPLPDHPDPAEGAKRTEQSDEILRRHGYQALADRLRSPDARRRAEA